LVGVVVAPDDLVAPREDRGRVERGLHGAERTTRRGDDLRRAQHRLRRHARPVGTFAADEPSLDERQLDVGVEPAEGADEMLAGRPSAEDDNPQRRLFALRNAFATAAGDSLLTSTALFIAMIAGSVSFDETALTVFVNDDPSCFATEVVTIGTT